MDEKKFSEVIAIILTELDNDRNRSVCRGVPLAMAVEKYCKEKGIGLFVPDNGVFKVPPKKEWTKDTWLRCHGALYFNFSMEKIKLSNEILKELRRRGVDDMKPVTRGGVEL